MSRILFRFVTLSTIFVAISAMNYLALGSHAGAPTPPPQHGLTGSYYLGARGWQTDAPPPAGAFYQVWSDQNDFMLPRTITGPAATRVDSQVAFGQAKGFHVGQKGPQLIWWPSGFAIPQGWGYTDKPWEGNHFVAATWKGYIHLPKAGTYYFATVSNGASAVYLNQARVALNGWGGGVLVSDAFSYAAGQVQDFVTQNSSAKDAYLADPRFQYAVPVPVEGPRDLPIEIDYDVAKSPSNWGSVALGIDLFWVTPDSPRDTKGKPIASIVPSDALYTEAPGPIEKPAVRSANATISADFLDFYFPSDKFVTVNVRLADKNGNPVAGKRVALSSVGGTAQYRDEIVQPEKLTDAHGETTGKLNVNHVYPVPHDATIFATDITDLVDVAQVGHVSFKKIAEGSFFPDTFSPYYDPHAPEVTPMPMQVGREITAKMPLLNRNKYAADLDVIFEIHGWNIGSGDWQEIGRVKNIRLQPGEHKDVSVKWTPDQATGHICFRVSVNATKIAAKIAAPQTLSAALLPISFQQGSSGQQGTQANAGSKTDNKTSVQPGPEPPECQHYWNGEYTNGVPFVNREMAQQWVNYWRDRLEELKRALDRSGLSADDRRKLDDSTRRVYGTITCLQWYANGGGGMPTRKEWDQRNLAELRARRDSAYVHWWDCVHASGAPRCTADEIVQLTDEVAALDKQINELERLDPSDPKYRHLAIAASDTVPGYLDALRISLERYQGARDVVDAEWMARHFTAAQLYERRVADSLRREAADLERKAQSFPDAKPQDTASSQSDRTALFERARQGGPIPADLRQQLLAKGIAEADLRRLEQPQPEVKQPVLLAQIPQNLRQKLLATGVTEADLKQLEEPPQPAGLPSTRQTLLDLAAYQRTSADKWQQIADNAINDEVNGRQATRLMQTFDIANPHERQETVDLFIRPISIPADWKLSIVNAAEDQAGQQGGKPGGAPPKYPVREIDPGKHYDITLPAKAESKVASVVIPVGEIGARTTARWAVEGKIGNELIGGMVHEMNLPYIIADLQLPPVGSKEVGEELPAPSRAWPGMVAEIVAGIIVVGLVVFFFIFWRRRRGRDTSRTP